MIAGRSLAHYTVLEKLGEGGMGVVYKARDAHLDRIVAIKVLPTHTVADPERRRRFVHEARAASALTHPHIVTIHDIDNVDGVDFIAMEYVDGQTLAQRLAENRPDIHEALTYAVEISDALAAAHRAGITHRDLKPANVMVNGQGLIKVLDFGLAKLTESAQLQPAASTRSVTPQTAEGVVVGTAAYMSPEQVEGQPVDARSDVFSFGAVLYELLTGRRAFQGHSAISTMSAILRDSPTALRTVRTDVPADLERVLNRCLEKNREARYSSAVELHRDLRTCQMRHEAGEIGAKSLLRRPRIVVPAAVILLAALAALGSFWQKSRRVTWALDVALPEIQRLLDKRDYATAFRIANEAQAYIPTNRRLAELWPEISATLSITTSVPGADVRFREYTGDSQWQFLGRSPITDARVPRGLKRWQIVKTGFQTVEAAASVESARPILRSTLQFTLDKDGSLPAGMVRVPGGEFQIWITGLDHLAPPPLDDFLIDKYEVTNKQFAEFVAKGGYRTRGFWKHPFVKDGRTLDWQEAVSAFRDSTGRPGPATWEGGAYPAGQDDFPVTGVSWYEAAAYAEFAGKTLPTIYHWNRAAWSQAGVGGATPIVLSSNFGGRGPASVGTNAGMNPFGTYDLAGNVKEWTWNAADPGGATRYILGGAWNEPVYMYNDPDAQPGFSRLANYGFRCVKNISTSNDTLRRPLFAARRNYDTETPVKDESYRIYRSFYQYDRNKLDPVVESSDDNPPHWKMEKISFNAAYGNERLTVYVFLPRNANAPYQPILYFPGSGALRARSFSQVVQQNGLEVDFIVRSGRALIYPIYKSTYERGDGLLYDRPNLTSGYREHVIAWYKDVARTTDYLATRKDMNLERLGYCGYSWGSTIAPIVLALEERIKASVLIIGGFWQQQGPPEVEDINFAPRVKSPVLMLNGKYDFVFPVETSQVPMFRLLGTSESDKRHLLFDSGHSIPRRDLITETLQWFDRYLGPAAR